jgi:hypothetical protein
MRVFWSMIGALLTLVPGSARTQEQLLALARVPKPVLAAVRSRFPEGKLRGAARETEEGRMTYEVTLTERGRSIDVTVNPQGALELIERQLLATELPPPVHQTLRAKYPHSSYRIIEEVITVAQGTETLSYYELLIAKADKTRVEVQIAADGRVLKEEPKGPNDTGR